jgi:polygalacturonase
MRENEKMKKIYLLLFFAIQQAVDDAQAIGGMVVIPPGNYVISSTINVRNTIRIEGKESILRSKFETRNWELILNIRKLMFDDYCSIFVQFSLFEIRNLKFEIRCLKYAI